MAFELRNDDLRISRSSGSSTGARRGGRIEITITHGPTGVSVRGTAGPEPRGRTRAQAQAVTKELTERLRRELTDKVAAYLRVPGR